MSEELDQATELMGDAWRNGMLPWMEGIEARLAALEASNGGGNGGTPEPPTNIIKVPVGGNLPGFGSLPAGTQVQLQRGGQWNRIDLGGGHDFSICAYGDLGAPLPKLRGNGIFVPAGTYSVEMSDLDIADCAIGMNVVPNGNVHNLTLRDSYIQRTTDSGIIDYSDHSTFMRLTMDQTGAAGTASHGIYANGRGTHIEGCHSKRAAKNGLSLRMDGLTVVGNKCEGTSIGIAYFTEMDPHEQDVSENIIEANDITGCSVGIYVSAAGGWPGGQEPSKPWLYPPFRINRNIISNPTGQKQGIMAEVPVKEHVGNQFNGNFSVTERYP